MLIYKKKILPEWLVYCGNPDCSHRVGHRVSPLANALCNPYISSSLVTLTTGSFVTPIHVMWQDLERLRL